MDPNPYAAPRVGDVTTGGPGGFGEPQPWEVGEVITEAWEAFKANWALLFAASFIATVAGAIPNQVASLLTTFGAIEPGTAPQFISMGFGILLGAVVQAFFQTGLIRLWLAAMRRETLKLEVIFSGGDRFGPMLAFTVLNLLAIYGGLLLFVVGAIFFAIAFFFGSFYVADANLGAIEAMKASWRVTDGQRMKIFVLGLANMGIFIAGLFACCIGVLASHAICGVSWAIVYTRISGGGRIVEAESAATLPG